MATAELTVAFQADGRCRILRSPEGVAQRDDGARGPRKPVPRTIQPGDPAGGGFHCPLPYRELGSAPVDLRVVLAPGLDRPADSFPRLDWRRTADAWVGTATLPSAPAFVGLNRGGPTPPAGAGFGWNFYGFFVFAAAFIAIYLASVRWIRRTTPAAAR